MDGFHARLDQMPDLMAVQTPSGRSAGGREDVGPGGHLHPCTNSDALRLLMLFVDRDGLPVRILGNPRLFAYSDQALDDEPRGNEDRIARPPEAVLCLVDDRA